MSLAPFKDMNGRVYDPVLGRFLSADPTIPDATNLQAYNRYSYVFNNPLSFTDPSGFRPFWKQRWFRTVASIAVAWVLGPGGYFGQSGVIAGNAFASSLVAGAASGFVSTGNLQGAFQGMFTGGLFYGAGQLGNTLNLANDSFGRAMLHAAAGCVSASAGGGECGSGAITAGFTKYAGSNLNFGSGDIAKLVKYSVIGGTASTIGGGKFANGAITGAFQYLFNEKGAGFLNSRESCPGECAQVFDPKANGWMWVPKEIAGQVASAAQTGGTIGGTRSVSQQDVVAMANTTSRTSDFLAVGALAAGQPEGALLFKIIGTAADSVVQYYRPSFSDAAINATSEFVSHSIPGLPVVKEFSGLLFKEGAKSFLELSGGQ